MNCYVLPSLRFILGHLLQLAIATVNISHSLAMRVKNYALRAIKGWVGGLTWLSVLQILKLSYLFALSLYVALSPTAGPVAQEAVIGVSTRVS